jgi:hypothetical protein
MKDIIESSFLKILCTIRLNVNACNKLAKIK